MQRPGLGKRRRSEVTQTVYVRPPELVAAEAAKRAKLELEDGTIVAQPVFVGPAFDAPVAPTVAAPVGPARNIPLGPSLPMEIMEKMTSEFEQNEEVEAEATQYVPARPDDAQLGAGSSLDDMIRREKEKKAERERERHRDGEKGKEKSKEKRKEKSKKRKHKDKSKRKRSSSSSSSSSSERNKSRSKKDEPKSLLQQHLAKLNAKPVSTAPRRMFDPDVDMAMSSIGTKQKMSLINKSSELMTRFSKGS